MQSLAHTTHTLTMDYSTRSCISPQVHVPIHFITYAPVSPQSSNPSKTDSAFLSSTSQTDEGTGVGGTAGPKASR